MDDVTLTKHLKSQKKLHLRSCFSNLLNIRNLEKPLLKLDLETLEKQLELFEHSRKSASAITPFENPILAGNSKAQKTGFKITQEKKAGCILLAGGQGSRLGFDGPKGTFLITPIKQKSLFQIFAEKVKAASILTKQDLPLAIMTSPLNEKETILFFKNNHFFGLNEKQVFFFSQTMLPFLDFEKKLVCKDPKTLALGPDGNGTLFNSFSKSGILDQWIQNGIEYLNIVLIDNPLGDPFDFELFGHLVENNNDIILKSCKRTSSNEKVGLIVNEGKKTVVIEYHELPKKLVFKNNPAANLSMMAMKINFAKKMSSIKLPLHKVKKKADIFNLETNELIKPNEPNVWKFEKYLFDILPYSKSTSVLLYPRADIFAPLKNLTGEDSVQSVQQAILDKERKIFEMVTKKTAPKHLFELCQQFYYPTPELKHHCKNIDPNLTYFFK